MSDEPEERREIASPGQRWAGSRVPDSSVESFSAPEPAKVIDVQHRRVISPAESAASAATQAEVREAEQRLFLAKAKERRYQLMAQKLEGMPQQIMRSGRQIQILKTRLADLDETKLKDRMCAAYLHFSGEFDARAREEFLLSGILLANAAIFRDLLAREIEQ